LFTFHTTQRNELCTFFKFKCPPGTLPNKKKYYLNANINLTLLSHYKRRDTAESGSDGSQPGCLSWLLIKSPLRPC